MSQRQVAKSLLVLNLSALSQSLRSSQEHGSSSSVALRTEEPAALISNDETAHQSQDAQCDGTEELSPRRLEATPFKTVVVFVSATVHLSKDGDQFQSVLRNMDVETIENVLTTAQKQIQVLQEAELYGLTDQLDWTDQGIFVRLQSKVYVFTGSVLCLCGKCQPHPRAGEIGEQESIAYVVASDPYRVLFAIAS